MTKFVPGSLVRFGIPQSICLRSCLFILPAVLIVLLILPTDSDAQELRDTRGREFYVTFLPNWHNQPQRRQDSLYIFMASEKTTNVRIFYRDYFGTPFSENLTLTPNVMTPFVIESEHFELVGPTSNFIDNSLNRQDQRLAPQSFRIESDEEITVYGMNEATWTSDAFSAFPKDVLGTEYMILTYKTDDLALCQFAVVATENNTEVEITLSDRSTRSQAGDVLRTTLNQGDVYMVQGGIGAPTDLSGTSITASRPVAVYTGHMRSRITFESDGISRDHLVQQLHPIPNWGGGAFVTPYVDSDVGSNDIRDLYRILAARDGTDIFLDGKYVTTLNRGEVREDFIENATWITATGPIMVAQFKKTSNISETELSVGDPFMIVNSPIEQYMDHYFFTSIDATFEFNGNLLPKFRDNQFVTIIAPTEAKETVRLDGQPLAEDDWTTLSITNYSYTHRLRVQSGTHTVTADTTVGVYVYGYGQADSYGYIGGMQFQEISEFPAPDIIPPFTRLDPCESGLFTGASFDTLQFDRGIQSISLEDESVNVNLVDVIITPPADSAIFTIELADPYQDGVAVVRSVDSSRTVRVETFRIPGFTVYVDRERPELQEVEAKGRADGSELCRQIEFHNYGSFPQDVTAIEWLSGASDISITPQQFSLQPDERQTITICASSEEELKIIDQLVIRGRCADAVTAAVEFDFEKDKNRPRILSSENPCDGFTRNVISDILDGDWGLGTIDILNAVNLETLEIDRTNLPDSIIVSASILDRTRPASYVIRAVDNAGNQLDTTIVVTPIDVEFLFTGDELDFGQVSIGNLRCDSISVRNNSGYPYELTEVRLRDNIRFSVPRSQIPLAIPPGETRTIQICFDALQALPYDDEIFITGDCFDANFKLLGTGIGASFTASSNCDVTITGRHSDVPGGLFVRNVFPNPTDGETRLVFGLPEGLQVRGHLYNAMGISLGPILDSHFDAGVYDLNLALTRPEQGVYYLVLDFGQERMTQQINLLR